MPTVPQSELPRPKSWDEFEDIVWDLYRRLWGIRTRSATGGGGKVPRMGK